MRKDQKRDRRWDLASGYLCIDGSSGYLAEDALLRILLKFQRWRLEAVC